MKCSLAVMGARGYRRIVGIGVMTCVLGVLAGACSSPQMETSVEIHTLSTRANTISGGEVLVQVSLTPEVATEQLAVTLNGTDVTAAFQPSVAPMTWVGLVDGLEEGTNDLVASAEGHADGQITLVNYPASGPILSGPQQTPFICETEAFGLGPALDEDCAVAMRVDYFYRTAAPAAGFYQVEPSPADEPEFTSTFEPFDSASPRPADLAQTTTSAGQTVPYIVRREMGTINRAVYVLAILHEPGTPLPDPWTMTSGWNGQLVYSFGGGCGAGHRQGRSAGGLRTESYLEESQLGDYALANGYALASASLNVFGTSCADLISTETMMMVKERFIEQFGVPHFTIGSGRSGGSMQQHLIANNYPGLLDGIIPTASYADSLTFMGPLYDCELLNHAFNTSTVSWTEEQKAAVAGHVTYAYCTRNGDRYPNLRPTNCDATAIPAELVYDPVTNPDGARCTYQDNMVNVYGLDSETGFARRPFDNVGVQYGLRALNDGEISAEQFLDLNQRIGGHDIDGGVIAERTVADPEAVQIAHQTGRLNDASQGLRAVPIIDSRPYTDGGEDVHDIVASHITRARLIAANGHADNQVFRTYAPGTSIQMVQQDNLATMSQWLGQIASDTAPADSALDKVVRNKPSGFMDACYTEDGEIITDSAQCQELFPVAENPRLVAGMPLSYDRLKCELQPIDPAAYTPSLTDAQVALLQEIFPQGVCDYSRAGVGQVAPETWLSYPSPGISAPLDSNDN